jgi:hypothetical protein
LGVHVLQKGSDLRKKYGSFLDYETLLKIFKDEEFVRFPTRIIFDSSKVEKGMFAVVEKEADEPTKSYVIYVHEHFQKRSGDLPAIVLYHVVTVNYGDFATHNEAEEFGSAALGPKSNKITRKIATNSGNPTPNITLSPH